VPYIYGDYPAQEDLYALFQARRDARGARDLGGGSSSRTRIAVQRVAQERAAQGRTLRRRSSSKATISPLFWTMLEATLGERHGARPVHTLAEIELLRSRFPIGSASSSLRSRTSRRRVRHLRRRRRSPTSSTSARPEAGDTRDCSMPCSTTPSRASPPAKESDGSISVSRPSKAAGS
jgi:hypothetical protein